MKRGYYKNCQECKKELVDGYKKDNPFNKLPDAQFCFNCEIVYSIEF
jgi:hypothetical protein